MNIIRQIIATDTEIVIKFDNGDILQKGNVPPELLSRIFREREELTFEDCYDIFFDANHEAKENKKIVEQVISDDRYYFAEDNLYRVGVPLPIPKFLANSIAEAIQNNNSALTESLDKFWMWTSLIKSPTARESFYDYCKYHKLPITREGFVIGYRRANLLGDKRLHSFVSEQLKKRRKNKKKINIMVYETPNGTYTLQNDPNLGYKPIEFLSVLNNIVLESATAGIKGKLKYRIGKETREDPKDVDWSKNECSRGIHLSHGTYYSEAYGDTSIACVFNPMDVIFCMPNANKLRVLAITPVSILENIGVFDLTPEVQDVIDSMMLNHTKKLSDLIKELNPEEYYDENQYHRLFSIYNTLQTTLTLDTKVIKSRYKKL